MSKVIDMFPRVCRYVGAVQQNAVNCVTNGSFRLFRVALPVADDFVDNLCICPIFVVGKIWSVVFRGVCVLGYLSVGMYKRGRANDPVCPIVTYWRWSATPFVPIPPSFLDGVFSSPPLWGGSWVISPHGLWILSPHIYQVFV